MIIKTTDKSFADYGATYDVEVIARYVEGYKAINKATGEIGFLVKGTFQIIDDEVQA